MAKPAKPLHETLQERARAKTREKKLHLEDLRALKKLEKDTNALREALMTYYKDTPEGQAEFLDSPHHDRPLEAVVDDLVDEMSRWKDG
jgi:hypothetical protein